MPGGGLGRSGIHAPARSLPSESSHAAPMPRHTEAAFQEEFPGAALTTDQLEFALAMERYMRLKKRPFPTWHEVLAVLTALGYRKVTTVAKEPRPHSE
jgi:hypothetical protein